MNYFEKNDDVWSNTSAKKEDIFKTRQIRYTKSRTEKNSFQPIGEDNNKEKLSSIKKAASFLRELPSRADKKKYYVSSAIALVSIIGILLLIITVFAPWMENNKKATVQKEAEKTHTVIADELIFDDSEDKRNEKKEELIKLFNKSADNPEAQYEYAMALLKIYEDDKAVESITYLSEQFLNNEKLSFPTNYLFLSALRNSYLLLGEYDKYVFATEEIIAMPDSDEAVEGDTRTFTEVKEILKNELEKPGEF